MINDQLGTDEPTLKKVEEGATERDLGTLFHNMDSLYDALGFNWYPNGVKRELAEETSSETDNRVDIKVLGLNIILSAYDIAAVALASDSVDEHYSGKHDLVDYLDLAVMPFDVDSATSDIEREFYKMVIGVKNLPYYSEGVSFINIFTGFDINGYLRSYVSYSSPELWNAITLELILEHNVKLALDISLRRIKESIDFGPYHMLFKEPFNTTDFLLELSHYGYNKTL